MDSRKENLEKLAREGFLHVLKEVFVFSPDELAGTVTIQDGSEEHGYQKYSAHIVGPINVDGYVLVREGGDTNYMVVRITSYNSGRHGHEACCPSGWFYEYTFRATFDTCA